MSAAEIGLQIQNVSKDLGGRTIVDDMLLEVRAGELTCLLGPSGCGKTTTLRMIGGFLIPDQGRILISGSDVTTMSPDKRPTAMVFQNYALWPHMTVFKNVAFGLRLRKLSKDEVDERVAKVLELVGLTHHVHSYPARISGGEQQRVALARALVLEPKVLLLDEPLSNLDAKLRVRVREDIREIQQRIGITTVFVTHDQDEALSISDRIAVMSGGRVEQYGDARSLYREPETTFVASFVGAMNSYEATVVPGGLELPGNVIVPCDELSAFGERDVGGGCAAGGRPRLAERRRRGRRGRAGGAPRALQGARAHGRPERGACVRRRGPAARRAGAGLVRAGAALPRRRAAAIPHAGLGVVPLALAHRGRLERGAREHRGGVRGGRPGGRRHDRAGHQANGGRRASSSCTIRRSNASGARRSRSPTRRWPTLALSAPVRIGSRRSRKRFAASTYR